MQLERSPLWHLIPLTLCAYVLVYLPLVKPLVVLIWMALLIVDIVRMRRRKEQELGPLHAETSVLETEPVVLWICLVMSIFGLHLYSMVLYLCFVSCSLALQLSLGGMSFVTTVSEKLPQEGVRAALAHMAVALTTTLYGILLANLIFLPIAVKVEKRIEERVILMCVIRDGTLFIKDKTPAAIVLDKLKAYLPTRRWASIERREAEGNA